MSVKWGSRNSEINFQVYSPFLSFWVVQLPGFGCRSRHLDFGQGCQVGNRLGCQVRDCAAAGDGLVSKAALAARRNLADGLAALCGSAVATVIITPSINSPYLIVVNRGSHLLAAP